MYEEATEGKRRGVLAPVMVDDILPPIGFRSVQAANLKGWDGKAPSAEFDRLLKDLSRILGTPPTKVKEEQKRQADLETARQDEIEAAKAREQADKEAQEQKRQEAELEAERARVAEAKHKVEREVPIHPDPTGNKRSRGRDTAIGFFGFGAAMVAAHVGTSLLPTETRPPFGGDLAGIVALMFVVAGILGAIASLVLARNWKSLACVIVPAILGWGIGLSQDPRYEGTQVGLTAGALAGIVLATLMKKLMKRDT